MKFVAAAKHIGKTTSLWSGKISLVEGCSI